MKNYSLKIFGTGYLLKTAILNKNQIETIQNNLQNQKVTLVDLIYYFDFLEKIGYETWEELPFESSHEIALICPENKLEITTKAKPILKTTTQSIVDPNLLFPIYPLQQSFALKNNTPQKKIVFGEVISGQIIHCKFSCPNFNSFQLKFDLLEHPNFQNKNCISGIYYNNEKLTSTSLQFISRSFIAFFI
jgi:hypothetical protein